MQFTLTSRDVIHVFWIPEARFKRDAFPGRETTFDLSFGTMIWSAPETSEA